MTEASYTPAIKGQTRGTWRDGLRGLLMRLYRPGMERGKLLRLYVAAAKKNDEFIEEALRAKFNNDYGAIVRFFETETETETEIDDAPAPKSNRRDPAERAATVAALVDRARQIILMDLVTPNGKLLRDCTGDECGQFGGWYLKIRDRVGSNIVGEVLAEQDLVSLRDAT